MAESKVSAMVTAVRNNDLEALRSMVASERAKHPGTDTSDYPTHAMFAALTAAARSNHPKALEILLGAGCCVVPSKP